MKLELLIFRRLKSDIKRPFGIDEMTLSNCMTIVLIITLTCRLLSKKNIFSYHK